MSIEFYASYLVCLLLNEQFSTYPSLLGLNSWFFILGEIVAPIMHQTAVVIGNPKGVDAGGVMVKIMFLSCISRQKKSERLIAL